MDYSQAMFSKGAGMTTDSLRLHTIALPDQVDFSLLDHLPKNATVFIRQGDGLVGSGVAARLSATGPNRIAELAAKWRALVASTDVIDEVQRPGTGLVAFGSFAFADDSASESVLIVPRVIVGTRDGQRWLTRIAGGADENFWDAPASISTNEPARFSDGAQSANGFAEAVKKAVSKIASGEFEKVVLARDLHASVEKDFDLRPALQKFAHRYPTCWTYSVEGLFGASPELLVRVSHKQVSARVLAGTAARGTDPDVDFAISSALASSPKNLSEHSFAVASLVDQLKTFCSAVDADTEPFSLQLPNLWHLASDVHGVLNDDASALDLAAVLHPTAAVAGTPTSTALGVIAELEPFDRGRYAGPVGWIGADGDGEWAIALRGALLQNGLITAYAGCGIVAESDPASELEETELKFRPIREALA
ncbi:MAG: isochorismate synthase MenF [Micrococcales bacterium]